MVLHIGDIWRWHNIIDGFTVDRLIVGFERGGHARVLEVAASSGLLQQTTYLVLQNAFERNDEIGFYKLMLEPVEFYLGIDG